MDDIEKNRVEYVARLEQQLKYAQEQLAQLRPIAEKWEPKVLPGSLNVANGSASITLSFGGKQQTMTLRLEALDNTSTENLTAYVSHSFAETLLAAQLTKVLRPEIERLQRGAAGLKSKL